MYNLQMNTKIGPSIGPVSEIVANCWEFNQGNAKTLHLRLPGEKYPIPRKGPTQREFFTLINPRQKAE